tara:strand:- start:1415 stop:1951 length:537 start_codon:yes stop_codon:yes gene_type:complete
MLEPIKKEEIPIIEKCPEGYLEIYKDADGKIVKQVLHKEGKIVARKTEPDAFQDGVDDILNKEEDYNLKDMSNSTLESFQAKKKAESDFITLADDGEKATGVVKEIKQLSKVGFGGKEVEVIRLAVETKDGVKFFDKGSKQWVDELVKKGVDVGVNITITRHGKKDDKKTKYEITKSK